MRSPDRGWVFALLLVAGLSYGQDGPSFKPDNRAPINVSADRASYENGRGVYEGRVELRQGLLSIKADSLTIDEQNRQVNRILAIGKPAQLEQNDGSVRAEAKSIEYFVANSKVILTGKALIRQQGSEIRGNRITYDSQQQTVVAEGDKGRNPERVNLTLQPRTSPQTAEPEDDKAPADQSKESSER
ncbi:lipopolysaccharide export system protein LptA [Litorivivens lipolytica]|uniref:Lipopolysaccharide export system protein LptA n=1 Tax=Litorivivens lipolytica TaxID=1524264 RepID=A0A7W4W457_9GAMM|nr:lipopolysaccharide transport periplasmic protein LptA [Litorivivens lipolytica]MBB3047111.1 lipopolysaccharide export system protein LptA [Litorivivens lipolytica]